MSKFTPAKTAAKKEKFLVAYRQLGTIFHASKVAGVSRDWVQDAVKKDPKFADACLVAEQDGVDNLEVVARQRAQKKSDLLLIFLLKAKRPEVFGDRLRVAFESSALSKLVERVVQVLHGLLPRTCPACKSNLDLHEPIAKELLRVSQEFTAKSSK